MLVKEAQYACLVAADNHLVTLVEICGLQLTVSVTVEPKDLSISELALVVICESSLGNVKLTWNRALRHVLVWPMSTGEDLRAEID